jgi:hypothetical protein
MRLAAAIPLPVAIVHVPAPAFDWLPGVLVLATMARTPGASAAMV